MTGRTHNPSRGAQNVPPGTQLNNMFEIDQLLTAGGMGEVYRGHNIQTNDPVAIKIVLPEFAQDDMILQLFRKEARVLNHLHHEAIVRYYVFSIDATSGLPFLAMEFVDGPALAERIREGPLDTASVVTLQRRLADGLQKAHEGGVVHRDIAPDNIILPEGRVDRAKIIDFGIARSATVGDGTLLGGAFAGKYGYVSPEQLGLFGGEVTHRSDIYSLGLVLAACARGRPLDMSGSQVEVIEKRRSVPDLSGIDTALLDLLQAMLQPDPDHRPQSMAEVATWPTLEEEPKTEIRHPGAGHLHRQRTHTPTRPPTAKPTGPPVAAPASVPPSGPSTPPPAADQPSGPHDAAQRSARPAAPPPPPPPRTRASGRRADRSRSRPGVVVLMLFLLVGAVGAIGGWAYVEFWSDGWYQAARGIAGDTQQTANGAQRPASEAEPVDEATADSAIDAEPPAEVDEPPTYTSADMVQFVSGYGGGGCFFARAAEIGDKHAEIVGFGNRRQPFDLLKSSFQQRFRFEPEIEYRDVVDPQCVMLEALNTLSTAGAAALDVELANDFIRSGNTLNGTVSGVAGRHLTVLMVDNSGNAYDLAAYTETSGDGAEFKIPLYLDEPMDVAPQLIIAIASPDPLASMDFDASRPAGELAASLLDEAATLPTGLGTAIAYFKFGS